MAVEFPIDCDVHPVVPGLPALMPYLDEMWREQVVRGNAQAVYGRG
jgi:hypothetical protein